MISCFLLTQTLLLKAGSIHGIVTDESGTLPDADVVLYSQKDTTKVLNTDMTTTDGKFAFQNLPEGHYMLKVEFMGYKTKRINVSLTKAKPDIKHMKVNMKDDTEMLTSVEVVGQRTALQVDADKKTFLVNAGAAVEGVSVSDLLREIPSVDVDVEGNVSLRNNEGVEIYINGKPAGMSDGNAAEVLEQLPANSIEKVEVITNPSSKFNAEGSAGIINIVLKEDAHKGYYGAVNGGLNVPIDGKPSGSLGASITYNTQKWMLTGSAGWQGRNNKGEVDRKLEHYLAGDTLLSTTNATNTRKRNSEFLNLGATYRINEKNNISWRGLASLAQRDFSSDIDVDNHREKDFNTTDGDRWLVNTGLDWNHDFEREGHSLRLAATLNRSNNANEKGYSTTQFDSLRQALDHTRTFRLENSETSMTQYTAQADYTLPLGKGHKLEMGAKADFSNSALQTDQARYEYDNQNVSGTHNSALNNGSLQSEKSNDFEMNQNVYALYASFNSHIGKRFKYNVGVRGEYTDMDWNEHLNTDHNSNQYFDPFPSAFLSYTLSEKDELQFNYTSRLTRPRMRLINPYRNVNDSKNLSYGNPDLLPEKTHALELNYVRNAEGDLYTASAYVKFTNDVISRYTWLDDAQISNTTFGNMGHSHEEGLELIAKNHLGKALTLTTNINLYNYTLQGGTFRVEQDEDGNTVPVSLSGNSSFSWSGKMSADLTLPWKLMGQVSANYNSPRASIQGRNHHLFTMNAGLKRAFLNRKLNASLSVRDIFNTFQFHSTNYGDDFWQDNKMQFMGTTFYLNLSYNFGNMGQGKKKPGQREGGNEDIEEFADF